MLALAAVLGRALDPAVIVVGLAIGWLSYPRWSLLLMLSFVAGVLFELAAVWMGAALGNVGVAQYALEIAAVLLWSLSLFVIRSLRKSPAAPRT